ncbi:MAG TPA: hypothetical protein PLK99_06115, partial [Burkholderiales bacterium]|nr:hypothetical protein [Burkholderiales bacterium]
MTEKDSIDSIARSIRKEYSELIDEMGSGREGNVDWWVSETASRNPYTSSLFHDICRLFVNGKLPKKERWFLFRPWLMHAKYAFVVLARWLACKMIYGNRSLPEGCTIVTTFVFDSSFSNGSYSDRYYNDFGGHVAKAEFEKFLFLPTCMNKLGNTFSTVRNMRNSSRY